MKKRILSILTVLVLCLTLLPTVALADEPDYTSLSGETLHEHSWTYTLSEDKATITKTCTASGCSTPAASGSVSISKYGDLTYERFRPRPAALVCTNIEVTSDDIFYTQGDTELPSAPTDAGDYRASITVGGVTAYVDYTIAPRTVTADSSTIIVSGDTTYKPTGVEPTVKVKDDKGNVISPSEYTVTYTDNTAVGTATVTITDKVGGNYTVNGSTTFEITKGTANLTVNPVTATYNGAPLEISDVSCYADVAGTWSWKNAAPKEVSDSGSHTLVFTPSDTTNYSPSETAVNVTINPAPLTISGVSATARDYVPSNTSVTLTGGTLRGVLAGDTVGFTLGTGTVANANAGTGKAVTTAITLTGDDAGNYALT